MDKHKTTLAMLLVAVMAIGASAAEPSGYYSKAYGKNKGALLKALESCISSHTTIAYKGGLNDLYETSDVRNGKVWDMYSTANFEFSNTCGNYSNVGDCWNKEHSMPQSWFGGGTPMYSDAFHVYPTDGKVNNQRSNYPYGECANGTTLPSHNGVKALGRKGTCTYPGYTGVVFEPDDEYKGDFARSYFYMAACYNSKIADWDTKDTNLGGNSYPAFNSWSVNMLLEWHRNDPVSQKELDRQEAVYKKQRNRNPFIDHPELAEYIWGDKKDSNWTGQAEIVPTLSSPANGSTIDMGATLTGVSLSAHIAVKGTDLSKDLNVSLASNFDGFSVSATKITAAQAMEGFDLVVTMRSDVAEQKSAEITISSDEVSSKVNVTALVQEPSTDPIITLGITSAPIRLSSLVGEQSKVLEIPIYTENITSSLEVRLTADDDESTVEISLDQTEWGNILTLDPDGETIYMRGKAMDKAGKYVSLLEVIGFGGPDAAEASIEADVEYVVMSDLPDPEVVTEDWEGCTSGGYWTERVQGAKFAWDFTDAGLWSDDSRHGQMTCRFGKKSTSSIAMAEDYAKGCAAFSFFASRFGSDGEATLSVEYSTDSGNTWKALESVVVSESSLTEHRWEGLEIKGNVRFRIVQSAGARLNIDDISITEFIDDTAVPTISAAADWKAVPARGGVLVTAPQGSHVVTYSLDARVVADTIVASRPQLVPLPSGIYIVTLSNTQGRKVVVK